MINTNPHPVPRHCSRCGNFIAHELQFAVCQQCRQQATKFFDSFDVVAYFDEESRLNRRAMRSGLSLLIFGLLAGTGLIFEFFPLLVFAPFAVLSFIIGTHAVATENSVKKKLCETIKQFQSKYQLIDQLKSRGTLTYLRLEDRETGTSSFGLCYHSETGMIFIGSNATHLSLSFSKVASIKQTTVSNKTRTNSSAIGYEIRLADSQLTQGLKGEISLTKLLVYPAIELIDSEHQSLTSFEAFIEKLHGLITDNKKSPELGRPRSWTL